MATLDHFLKFSDAQSIAVGPGTYNSTNVLDLSAAQAELGDGEELYVIIDILGPLAGGTSINFQYVTDSDDALGSAALLQQTGALATAALNALGQLILPTFSSVPYEQYVGMQYTTLGTFTGPSAISARLGKRPTNWAARPGENVSLYKAP